MKVYLKFLNTCTTRRHKLQQYADFISANGHEIVQDPDLCDTILIWSCAFRTDVHANSILQIKYYQEKYPDKKIIVTGCLPDIDPAFSKTFSGQIISWKWDRQEMEEFFGNKKSLKLEHIFAEKSIDKNGNKFVTFADQFIKLLVSEGCNYKCAYCSERQAFPVYHSFPEDDLVSAYEKLSSETGKHKVILLADSLGEYGCDINSSLPSLIEKFKRADLEIKIALNNLNPTNFIQYFDEMQNFLDEGIIEHFNLPIQSASDKILKLMGRGYTKKDIEKIYGMLNDMKFIEFDTHLILGFPGETEFDYRETVDFIQKYKPKYVLVSKYMESINAPSVKLKGKVDEKTTNERVQHITEILTNKNIIFNIEGSQFALSRIANLNDIK